MFRPFGLNDLIALVLAARWTVMLSAIAFAGGSVGGLTIALCRISERPPLRLAATAFIRIFQGTPLLMQLFIAFFMGAAFGLDVDPLTAASAALIANASAFLGEIWRGCIETVPKGQWEAGTALGLSRFSLLTYVILPQAVRISIPPTIGYLVQLIKNTSLAAIIGFTEITRSAQVLNSATFKPFLVFGSVAAIYFVLCWPLTRLGAAMENRQRHYSVT